MGRGQHAWWQLVTVLCKAPSLQEAVGSPRQFLYPWLSLASFHSSLNLGTGRAKKSSTSLPLASCKHVHDHTVSLLLLRLPKATKLRTSRSWQSPGPVPASQFPSPKPEV